MDILNNGNSAFLIDNWTDVSTGNIKGFINSDEAEGPVRIGFAGAHGVGKNTIARKVAKSLDLPFIQQIPKSAKELGFKLNKRTDMKSQMAIWLAQLHEQLNQTNFVSDRTLIDNFAYMTYLDRHMDLGMDKYLVRAMGNITAGVSYEQYSVVFYIPPSLPILPNGVRSTDKRYQKDIDKIIFGFLNSFGVDYVPLPGQLATKFETAMTFISESGLLQAWIDDEGE